MKHSLNTLKTTLKHCWNSLETNLKFYENTLVILLKHFWNNLTLNAPNGSSLTFTTHRQTNRQTQSVTLSVLELPIAAKNMKVVNQQTLYYGQYCLRFLYYSCSLSYECLWPIVLWWPLNTWKQKGKGIDSCYSARLYLRILCNQLAHFTGEERLIKWPPCWL